MAVSSEHPYVCTNFLVDVGLWDPHGPAGGFTEVCLPAGELDVVEYRSGNAAIPGRLKLVGLPHYDRVILTRGADGSLELYQWWDQARKGQPDRRTVTIQLLSEDRTEVVMTWKLHRAWPVAHRFSRLVAAESEALLEIVELEYERYEIE